MVDFKKMRKDSMKKSLKVFMMDSEGFEYWVGYSAQACYDHRIQVTGGGKNDGFAVDQLQALSEDDMCSMRMEMEDGRTLSFRDALNELVDLDVEFPRFLCGQEC